MSIVMTAAGEALTARLQSEGKPLIIDTFVFANVPGLDPRLRRAARFRPGMSSMNIRSRRNTGPM